MKYTVSFDLTSVNFSQLIDGKMNFSNLKNQTGKEVNMYRLKFMAVNKVYTKILTDLFVTFINKTDGKAFNLQSDDIKVNHPNTES